jgi:hypothetical protein
MSGKETFAVVLLLSIQAAAQGVPVNVVQNPAAGASQNIVQLPDTTMHNPSSFSVNNEAGIRYVVSSYNWPTQSPNTNLTNVSVNTLTLSPCPASLLVLSGTLPFTRIWIADNNQSKSGGSYDFLHNLPAAGRSNREHQLLVVEQPYRLGVHLGFSVPGNSRGNQRGKHYVA